MIYISKENQSIYDICLMTYGTLDFLGKLVSDNLNNIDEPLSFNQQIYWDETINNKNANQKRTISNVMMSTIDTNTIIMTSYYPYDFPFNL